MADADVWAGVERLRAWLDDNSPVTGDFGRVMRVMKVGEEFGETIEALHGVMGANPRKGLSHTWEDVRTELCDVIVTAMVALASLTPQPRAVFEARLQQLLAQRSLPPADSAKAV